MWEIKFSCAIIENGMGINVASIQQLGDNNNIFDSNGIHQGVIEPNLDNGYTITDQNGLPIGHITSDGIIQNEKFVPIGTAQDLGHNTLITDQHGQNVANINNDSGTVSDPTGERVFRIKQV